MNTWEIRLQFVRQFPLAQLTGNHAFCNATVLSTVDFFMQMNEANITNLVQFEFEVVSDTPYTDLNCQAIYHHKQGNIDVQLVSDVRLKSNAQKFLQQMPLHFRNEFNNMPKLAKKLIWNWAFAVCSDYLTSHQ